MQVGEVLPHTRYDSDNIDNDFMLLFLSDLAPQEAAFVKLNSDPVVPAAGSSVTVMGHGLTVTVHNGIELGTSKELIESKVNIISNEECQQSEGIITVPYTDFEVKVNETFKEYITENMLWFWCCQCVVKMVSL